MIKSDHYYLTIKNKSDRCHLTIKRDHYYIMIWNSKFHQTHLETEVRLWTHSHDFPNGKYNGSNKDTHHQDACQTGVWCHSPRRKQGARTLTCINILYMIQIMINQVNDLINRKHMTQLTRQKYLNADLEFRVPHQYDASLAGPSGADNWVPRALLSSHFIIYLVLTRFSFFPFVSFTLEWS